MQGAAMPETAVHEHRYTGARESQVWLSRQPGLETEAQPGSPQGSTQQNFRSSASASYAGHQLASLRLNGDCLFH